MEKGGFPYRHPLWANKKQMKKVLLMRAILFLLALTLTLSAVFYIDRRKKEYWRIQKELEDSRKELASKCSIMPYVTAKLPDGYKVAISPEMIKDPGKQMSLSYIPAGYVLEEQIKSKMTVRLTYSNDNGNFFTILQSKEYASFDAFFDGYLDTIVLDNGLIATYFLQNGSSTSYCVFDQGLVTLGGTIDKSEMKKILDGLEWRVQQ